MKKIIKTVKKFTAGFMLLALTVASFGFAPNKVAQAATTWDTTGAYIINMNHEGEDYHHEMSLVQDDLDKLTGKGGSPVGVLTYRWVITSGGVTGNRIDFLADYMATPDAVTPQTTMHLVGTIASDGTLSGKWSDNYAGAARAGVFSTVKGMATTKPTPPPVTSRVTIQKYVDGKMATAVSTHNTDFVMNAPYIINGAPGALQYTLGKGGYNGSTVAYQAMSANLPNGSNYGTYERIDTTTGVNCAAGTPFALIGYTYGETLAEARAATPSLAPPNFTNIKSDKYVIVLNDDCSTAVGGQIGGEIVSGNGILKVTSIDMTDSTATANNSFEDGWKYVFNITVPTNEKNLSMKFADWVRTSGTETIPAGSNMRISSEQANNGGAFVPITEANMYSTPALIMTTDLNPAIEGIQVKVTVEVKIPTSTTNGSYTTSYGVKSK